MQQELEAKLVALHQSSASSSAPSNAGAQLPPCYIVITAVEGAADCPALMAGLHAGDKISKMDGRGWGALLSMSRG
jgi:hypothetical protein